MNSKQRINFLFGKIYANCGEGSRAWNEAEEIEKLIEEREQALVDALQKILESSARNYDRSKLRAFYEAGQAAFNALTALGVEPKTGRTLFYVETSTSTEPSP